MKKRTRLAILISILVVIGIIILLFGMNILGIKCYEQMDLASEHYHSLLANNTKEEAIQLTADWLKKSFWVLDAFVTIDGGSIGIETICYPGRRDYVILHGIVQPRWDPDSSQ